MSTPANTLFAGVHGTNGRKINILPKRSPKAITDLINSIIADDPEPFFVLDLGVVVDLYKKWTSTLPDIHPFYAVKCNTEPALIGTLASLGAGFDCASRSEAEAVLAAGVRPDRIIYANTCKPQSHIKYAASTGINLATFDSSDELAKISRYHPKSSLLLRIKVRDDGARMPMASKFGAEPEEVTGLLLAARSASLNVIGVSFHVGSAATNFKTYRLAIASARAVFDAADELGCPRMNVLNIGGGFTAGSKFDEAAEVIKSSIKHYFSDRADIKLMAEPGRFFPETAFTLTTNIIGKRVRRGAREYWIDDGIHGSMYIIKYTGAPMTLTPLLTRDITEEETYTSTVFGPTCDAGDRVFTGLQLPELRVGDSFVSHNMGAYSTSMGTSFNGFITSAIKVHLAYSPTFHAL